MEKNNITYFYLLIYSKETLNGYIRSEAQWLPWKEEDWELDIRGRIILLRLHISQGSSQKWIQDCVCVWCKEIYYKEWAPVFMEATTTQALHGKSASWRPRRADGLIPSEGQPAEDPGRVYVSVGVCRQEAADVPVSRQSGRKNSL